ncbi:trichohyalin isoform X2 [Aethina tumida]|uniref:trichohyalin isoform X2 n=1 Tax=Aethina tumida TaxID=116153 RepID=UPI0021489D32|nr:trichohyalin isoform X2 [Aethina tumida]
MSLQEIVKTPEPKIIKSQVDLKKHEKQTSVESPKVKIKIKSCLKKSAVRESNGHPSMVLMDQEPRPNAENVETPREQKTFGINSCEKKVKVSPRKVSPTKMPSWKTSGIPVLKKPNLVPGKSLMSRRPKALSMNTQSLEVQFTNKKKRLQLMTKDISERQQPIMELYEELAIMKQRLNLLGKNVNLKDIKILTFEEIKEQKRQQQQVEKEKEKHQRGSGENIPKKFREELERQKQISEEVTSQVLELNKKLDDKDVIYIKELNQKDMFIKNLSEKIKKLEVCVENEKKTAAEFKNKNVTNAQTIKTLTSKISDYDCKLKTAEEKNVDLNKKIKEAQETIKTQEKNWDKEKTDLNATIKEQHEHLSKLIESRKDNTKTEEINQKLVEQMEELKKQLIFSNEKLEQERLEKEQLSKSRVEIQKRLMESNKLLDLERLEKEKAQQRRINLERFRSGGSSPAIDLEVVEIASKVLINKFKDRFDQLQQEKVGLSPMITPPPPVRRDSKTEKELESATKKILKYQQLVAEKEEALKKKTDELSGVASEIRRLKVQQELLDEQKGEFVNILEECHSELDRQSKLSDDNIRKIAELETTIRNQINKMDEMQHLLQQHEKVVELLRTSLESLFLEKENLTNFVVELKLLVQDANNENWKKGQLIKELQDKIDVSELTVSELEKDLAATNERRHKLEKTIGALEKELQSIKAQKNLVVNIQAGRESRRSSGKLDSKIEGLERSRLDKLDMFPEKVSQEQLPTDAKSLLNVSLQKMDFLRSRLHMLGGQTSRNNSMGRKTQTFSNQRSGRNFERVMALSAGRRNSESKRDVGCEGGGYHCSEFDYEEVSMVLDKLPVLTASAMTQEDVELLGQEQ